MAQTLKYRGIRRNSMKKKPTLDGYIDTERGFTLLRCSKCREFYSKGKPHVCGEKNSYRLTSKLLKEDKPE
jgi:hypothetical protein